MATYATDLQTITLADSGTFTEFSSFAGGSAPSLTTENFIHNGSAVDQATGQALNQTISIAFDFGSNISWTAGWVVMAWTSYAAPTNLQTWASGGMRIGIGSSLAAVDLFNAVGSDFGTYPYGNWQNTAIDPQVTEDQVTSGGNGGNYRYFGSVCNTLAKITKGSPHAIDAFRYGRGQLQVTGTGADFAGMASANDATTARWGLFQKEGGGYLWKGLMSLGLAGTSVTFSDSNKAIRVEDTPRVAAGFNKVEVRNAGSTVSLTSIAFSGVQTSITGSAPVSRGDLQVVDNATVTLTGCSFTDWGTSSYLGNTSVSTCVFRRAGTVTLGGATVTGSLFDSTHAAAAVSATTVANLTGCTFISDGSSHAVDLGTISSTQTMSWNNQYSGYASSNGSSGNEVIKVNVSSGQTLTINNDSGSANTLSVYNTGTGSVSVVTGQKTVTIGAQVSLVGAEVRIYDNDGGSHFFGTELDGVESSAASTFPYTGAQGNSVIIQIMLTGYEEYTQVYTMPSANTTLTVVLVKEENQ